LLSWLSQVWQANILSSHSLTSSWEQNCLPWRSTGLDLCWIVSHSTLLLIVEWCRGQWLLSSCADSIMWNKEYEKRDRFSSRITSNDAVIWIQNVSKCIVSCLVFSWSQCRNCLIYNVWVSFIHHKYLSNSYYMWDTILGSGDTTLNRGDSPCLHKAYLLVRKQTTGTTVLERGKNNEACR
jgi:hypothetical protein